jgi:26S proteasome regulatory subunit T6
LEIRWSFDWPDLHKIVSRDYVAPGFRRFELRPKPTKSRHENMALVSFYESKIEAAEREITQKTSNLRRLEAQRYQLNTRVRRLKEELQLLQQPASYVGEVVRTMGKKKVLVKVHPEGKYGES